MKQNHLISMILFLFFLTSCNPSDQAAATKMGGVLPNATTPPRLPDEGLNLSEGKVLKIVASGIGVQNEIFDHSMTVHTSLSLKAALFDLKGNYLEDVPATWALSNTSFQSSDLSLNGTLNQLTFIPTTGGVVSIRATYLTSDGKVINNQDTTGLITVSDPSAPSSLSQLRIFKIVAAGVGPQATVENLSMSVLSPASMKGAIYDLSGNFISDAPAYWSFSNSIFPVADLTSSVDLITGTFNPSRPGSVVINAAYAGNNTNVINPTDSTGLITVTNIQVPHSVQIFGGNNQSTAVNNNLASPLQLKVLDEYGIGIAGVSVTFSVSQGSGAIIGTNPVITDVNGVASAVVKVGTAAGGNNNQYRATVDAFPVLLADFIATATPGPQNHLTFTTQPAVLFANTAFGVQPVVELRDQYNNLISATGTITMSKSAGTGTLNGTLTAAMSNGVATFTNLSFDTAGSGVILQASNGSVTGLSSALIIGSPPPGACVMNNHLFYTADGGCRHLSTGLVWSAKSSITYSWYEAVWDARLPISSPPDADDFGRTNDYPEGVVSCGSSACEDSNNTAHTMVSTSYCKDLNEGGRTDWRLPTEQELYAVAIAGGSAYLQTGSVNESIGSSSSAGTTYKAVNLTNSSISTLSNKTSKQRIYCVRGGNRSATAPTKILVTGGSTIIGQGLPLTTPLSVAITNANNSIVNLGGITLTVSTNLGTLSGSTTAVTDYYGVATFNNISLDTPGNATLTISYNGGGLYSLTPATHSIRVGPAKHTCVADSGAFQTGNGGCQDMSTGLVWSYNAPSAMTWYAAIWDSQQPGAPARDADDYGRGNDYSEGDSDNCFFNSSNTLCDQTSLNVFYSGAVSTSAYCKSLVESGYSDWRMPTASDFSGAIANGALSHFNLMATGLYWSTSRTAANDEIIYYSIPSGSTGDTAPTSAFNVICVRGGIRNNPTKIVLSSQPSLMATNSIPTTPFDVRVRDASNNNVNASGRTVTISASGSGISGTLTAVTDVRGIATFNAFQLNTSGTITLTFSSPGLASAVTTVESRTGVGIHICAVENSRFRSQFGGCHDNVTNLAWSSRSNATTWHQAIWDSSTVGSTAADGNDNGRINDYDPAVTLTGNYDSNSISYCKNLVEGGYSDWRVPTKDEWEAVWLGGANIAFPAGSANLASNIIPTTAATNFGCYWTSTSASANSTSAHYFSARVGTANSTALKSANSLTGSTPCNSNSGTWNFNVVCVRSSSP